MASELTSVVLEFSEDDLTDSTPTWQDVTNPYLRSIEWWSGVDNEGDEPQPGGAVIVLKNINRDWEPDYTGGRFSPNVVYGRRFRLTLNDGTGATQEGLWYITDISIDYIADTDYSLVTITCADGFEVLALDDLPTLDPPDADSYADVVAFDEPWGYWRLGEPAGTKVVSHLRLSKRKFGKKGHRRRHRTRWKTTETRAEVAGIAGPAGTYKQNPALGTAGAILGDTDTAVLFNGDNATFIADDASTASAGNSVCVEAWAKITSTASLIVFFSGPKDTGSGSLTYELRFRGTGTTKFDFVVRDAVGDVVAVGGATPNTGEWYHLVGTFDGVATRIYVNGALDGETLTPFVMMSGTDGQPFFIATNTLAGGPGSNTSIDEVALYEAPLSPERILAHYTAGSARGWPEQTAGARIADIATHALWSEASIQTTGRNVQPQMKHGQARLEEISELMQAEGPQTLFFFNGTGDPVYLGYEWKATSSAYNVVQATFGDEPGDIGIEGIEPVYDNETFNVVEASREGGELVSVGAGGTPRRVNPDFTDLLLTDDVYVESLAGHVLDLYESPAMRPKSITVNGAKAVRQILDLKTGHLIRVRKGMDRVTHILGFRKSLSADRHLICTYNLARGFNADLAQWQAGITGFSEAGQTTKAA